MSYFGQYVGEYPGNWWGAAIAPPPPPPVQQSRGGYGPRRRRPKQREFDDELRTKEDIRQRILAMIAPSAEAAVVVTRGNVVAVLPDEGSQIALPVPPAFNAAEVAQMVVEQLNAFGVGAERARTAEAQARARALVDAFIAEQERRTRKRRREEEWLLLMN